MPSLTGNLENRVRKLAKPSNSAQALQPLFEAISNSLYAIEDRYDARKHTEGKITVEVHDLLDHDNIEIIVSDNGVGLDHDHFTAFLTIDTDFKFKKGGKGVGRLFWLDAFSETYIETRYSNINSVTTAAYSFVLEANNQVRETECEGILPKGHIGTSIRFRGLRSLEYRQFFPRTAEEFHRYFSSHFISDFLLATAPQVHLDVDGNSAHYPDAVAELVVGTKLGPISLEAQPYGTIEITGFACQSSASFGLDGLHQLHFLANGRTVETRKVDNLLGLPTIYRDEQSGLVFHGCVSGEFLNTRVNEGRTGFNLSESDMKKLSRACIDLVKTSFFPEQIKEFNIIRKERYESFVARHPIFGFDDVDVQLTRVPFHALKAEDFAAGLVKYQIRREEERQKALSDILNILDSDNNLPANFGETVTSAAEGIHASERLALAQHVVRRKLVLEIMERLLERNRKRTNRADDHYLEETLHSLICPMKVRGDDPTERKSRAHDLWIVDERLAFTRAFASDKRLDQLLKTGGSAQRPDLVLWDFAMGMGVTDPNINAEHVDLSKPLDKVMVVEFKKPGRENYPEAKDQVEQQITRYLAQLQSGEIETFDRRRVRIAKDCVFFCYVIADIVGDLKLQLSGWETVANGQGRIRKLSGEYSGFIEVIQWDDLVNDAWNRNQALLFSAGLKRGNPINIEHVSADSVEQDNIEDEEES